MDGIDLERHMYLLEYNMYSGRFFYKMQCRKGLNKLCLDVFEEREFCNVFVVVTHPIKAQTNLVTKSWVTKSHRDGHREDR